MLALLDGARGSPQLSAGRRRRRPLRVHGSVHRSRRRDWLGGGKRRLRARVRRRRRHSRRCRRDDLAVPGYDMSGAWTQPRRPPDVTLPAIAGTIVVALALPIFLINGWRIEGWLLGATLWTASQLFGVVLHRVHSRTGNLAAAGVAA